VRHRSRHGGAVPLPAAEIRPAECVEAVDREVDEPSAFGREFRHPWRERSPGGERAARLGDRHPQRFRSEPVGGDLDRDSIGRQLDVGDSQSGVAELRPAKEPKALVVDEGGNVVAEFRQLLPGSERGRSRSPSAPQLTPESGEELGNGTRMKPRHEQPSHRLAMMAHLHRGEQPGAIGGIQPPVLL
jgi:hypothetical protein